MGLQSPFLISFCVVAANWRDVSASRGVLAGSKLLEATARREKESAERREMLSANRRREWVGWTEAGKAAIMGRRRRAAIVDFMVELIDK
jgi:hypothetical protein